MEYVKGMWRMLQHHTPDDYVLATSTARNVRDFVEHCLGGVDFDWQQHVRIDESYLRPTELDALIGDASKAQDPSSGRPRPSLPGSRRSWPTPSSRRWRRAER